MKTWKCIALVFALAGPARAQETIAVTLTFQGAAVTAGAVRRVEQPAPQQFQTPQDAALFVEVLAADGGVVYAAEVNDPRASCSGLRDERTAAGSDPVTLPPAACEVLVPAADAAQLVVYRRTSADPETGRTELARVSL